MTAERNAQPTEMHPTALRFQQRAAEAGLDISVEELAESTRTAAEAPAAVGCELGQIVKSVVLVDDGQRPILCLCAGDRMVDLQRVGAGLEMARGRQVKELTGFAIGGVPPLGHERPLPTVVDRSLQRYDRVWCAAGTPRSLFGVALTDLLAAIPGAELRDVTVG
jgi:prolyl-tRNA editing enzyme YbaK/EbsC (Cys-tRNA(Pro) deacylase)